MVQEIEVDQPIQLFMKQHAYYVNSYRYEKLSTLDTWLEETIAESLEDFVLQGM